MAIYDPSELIALCRGLTEDGDLTNKEVYELAEWLNAHPEACDEWPGKTLVGPLNEIWSDGKVTRSELKRISRLLAKIEREWAEEVASESIENAREVAREAAKAFDRACAMLPSIPRVVYEKSSSGQGFYSVDLSTHTCTCADWVSYRKNRPQGHLGRCCKHIASVLFEIEPPKGWPSWLGALLKDCVERERGTNPGNEWFVIKAGRSDVLLCCGNGDWANVYSADGEAYGYNVVQGRWAYGLAPTHSAAILSVIAQHRPSS